MECEFNIGDKVYSGDWFYGTIVDIIDGEYAVVEFETNGGGGSFFFDLSELRRAEDENERRNK